LEQRVLTVPGITAAMGGSYMFTKTATANLREKDDYINSALGGFLAGAIMGSRCELLNFSITDECYALLTIQE